VKQFSVEAPPVKETANLTLPVDASAEPSTA
jgi:hypothetical protein